MGGMSQPARVGRVHVIAGRRAPYDPHPDGEMVLLCRPDPLIIDRTPGGIVWREGQGEGGSGRRKGGEETELPEILAANSPHGIKDEGGSRLTGCPGEFCRCPDGIRK